MPNIDTATLYNGKIYLRARVKWVVSFGTTHSKETKKLTLSPKASLSFFFFFFSCNFCWNMTENKNTEIPRGLRLYLRFTVVLKVTKLLNCQKMVFKAGDYEVKLQNYLWLTSIRRVCRSVCIEDRAWKIEHWSLRRLQPEDVALVSCKQQHTFKKKCFVATKIDPVPIWQIDKQWLNTPQH